MEQYCSRIYQRAKASRQGGTTLTSPELEDRQRKWARLLRKGKRSWCGAKIEEYAQLLAAYHSVGDDNVPTWVYHTYGVVARRLQSRTGEFSSTLSI